MPLPQAIVEQEKKAMETHKKVYGEGNTDKDTDTPEKVEVLPPTPANTPPDEQDVKPPESKPEDKGEDYKQLYDALTTEHEKLKSQHSVLTGKYNVEVPRLHQDIRDLSGQVKALTEKLETKPKNEPIAPPKEIQESLDALKEDLGEKNYAALKAVLEYYTKPLEGKLKSYEERVSANEKTSAKERQDRFYETLDRLCPEWKTLKDDPDFPAFLANPAPFTGERLYEVAEKAQNSLNAARLAEVFNAFKATMNPEKPEVVEEVRPDKEALLEPTSSGGKPPLESPKVKQFKASEIEENYQRYRRGEFRGKEDKWEKLEAAMDACIAAQAVLPG